MSAWGLFFFFSSIYNQELSLFGSKSLSPPFNLHSKPADFKLVVLLIPLSKQVLLPACQAHSSQSAPDNTPETKTEWPSRLFKLCGDFEPLPTPRKTRNFFLSNNRSTSKLCVSAGPEPSGPEPVLLQVLSIYRPRVLATRRRAFNYSTKAAETPPPERWRRAALLLFEPNHQQRGVQRSSWYFFSLHLFSCF